MRSDIIQHGVVSVDLAHQAAKPTINTPTQSRSWLHTTLPRPRQPSPDCLRLWMHSWSGWTLAIFCRLGRRPVCAHLARREISANANGECLWARTPPGVDVHTGRKVR